MEKEKEKHDGSTKRSADSVVTEDKEYATYIPSVDISESKNP